MVPLPDQSYQVVEALGRLTVLTTRVAALLAVVGAADVAAEVIKIPQSAFSGAESVIVFDVSSNQPLPYTEDAATFERFSGFASTVGFFDVLWLSGPGVLQITFASPVSRVGFALSTQFGEPTLTAQAFLDAQGEHSIGQVSLGTFGQLTSTFVGLEGDRLFSRVDVAVTGVTQSASYWIDDFRFESLAPADTDGDTLPDLWEERFGLNPSSAAGADGAAGDPDFDGRTNLQEFEDQTHPRGTFTGYFAEGATGAFFDTTLALLNYASVPDAPVPPPDATALLRFQTGHGTTLPYSLSVPARHRVTLDAGTVLGLSAAEFSTVIESDVDLVADRTMSWNASAYGSHAETSVAAPGQHWYLAEGATHSGFQLFYLIQNPNAEAATVEVEYLLPAPHPPVVKSYVVPPMSRFNVWVNTEPELASTDLSAVISSDRDIIVERAMYLDRPGQIFAAGHESAAVAAPATNWFLAEGATGPYFDLFVLIANPNTAAAEIEARFLLPDGTVIPRTCTVAPKSRFNIWVDAEGGQLADTAVSTTITSTNGVPVLVERAMWWPGPTSLTWAEAHNSAGATSAGSHWGLAEGEQGGPRSIETYILIANTSDFDSEAHLTLVFEDGTTAEKVVPIAANSRTNVPVGAPEESGGFGAIVQNRRFGAEVETLGVCGESPPAEIVVERSMYSNATNATWAAGTNALATRLPERTCALSR